MAPTGAGSCTGTSRSRTSEGRGTAYGGASAIPLNTVTPLDAGTNVVMLAAVGVVPPSTNSGRVREIVAGQLYCDAANDTQGIFAVGTGLPTGTATATPLSGTVDANASYYAFVMLDLVGSDGVIDTMYVADDRSTARRRDASPYHADARR